MYVVKANGTKQEFDAEKMMNTCIRSGMSKREARKIVEKIIPNVYDGISTKAVFEYIEKELERKFEKNVHYLRLRNSLSEIDPASFELYAAKILQNFGYETFHDRQIKGKYVEHQIDLIASREGKKYLVECKHHNNPHRFTGLGIALQVQARLEDVNAAKKMFDAAWIFSNNKFSIHAIQYSKGMGIRLTGWGHGYEKFASIESMIQSKNIFPVTMLSISQEEKRALLEKKIVTLQDLMQRGETTCPAIWERAKHFLKL